MAHYNEENAYDNTDSFGAQNVSLFQVSDSLLATLVHNKTTVVPRRQEPLVASKNLN
jgi:hypothetical protein